MSPTKTGKHTNCICGADGPPGFQRRGAHIVLDQRRRGQGWIEARSKAFGAEHCFNENMSCKTQRGDTPPGSADIKFDVISSQIMVPTTGMAYLMEVASPTMEVTDPAMEVIDQFACGGALLAVRRNPPQSYQTGESFFLTTPIGAGKRFGDNLCQTST